MSKYPSLVVRLWHSAPWQTGPLMRVSDRIQGSVGVFAIAVMLLAVPVAGAAGTAGYTGAVARIEAENATKVATTATVVADPKSSSVIESSGATDVRTEAEVRWDRNGRNGSAVVEVPGKSKAGDEISIWLGPDGQPAAAPIRPDTAAGTGVALGLVLLGATWAAALALVWGTGRLLDLRRAAGWEQAWREFDRQDGQLS